MKTLPTYAWMAILLSGIYLGKAPAIQGEGLRVRVIPGLDGNCRTGDWFPIRLEIENTGGDLEGEIQITGEDPGDLASTYGKPFSATGGSRKSFTILVFPENFLFFATSSQQDIRRNSRHSNKRCSCDDQDRSRQQ